MDVLANTHVGSNKRWGEKRYHSLDYELKHQFGEKVYRIPLNGGMTCPNRDGTIGNDSYGIGFHCVLVCGFR